MGWFDWKAPWCRPTLLHCTATDVLGVAAVVLGVGGTFSAVMVAYLVRRMVPDAG